MKKLALLPIFLILSTVYADNANVSLNYKDIVEPNETVEIDIKIKNTSTTYLWKCKASVDLGLLGDEIQYFTIISEPSWDEKIQVGSSVNGKIKIKISSDADNVKLRIPIIVSGEEGGCIGGCTPFMEGPFYAEVIVKNKGIETFNYAESLYNEGKYEEAMEKYDEAKKYFLNYFDDKNARICLIKAKNCEGHLKLNSGISYFNAGDLDNAKKEFEDAKSVFENIGDEEMIGICEEWMEKCIPPSTTPPASTTPPTTLAPTTSPPTTPPVTTPLATSPPQGSTTKTIFLFLLLIAIASVIIVTIKITKK
jgi:tetratricopeptide (TPR) repeat protein